MQKEIVYLDLFSGTGGFAKGLLSAGFVFKEHYFSEIDESAIANYQYNFKNAKALGDITKIKNQKIHRPNLITFGSPCQDISVAGEQQGIEGKRSKLFFEAVRLIREYQPDTFIFENVKGLFSSNQGKDFETILKTFANLGLYDIEWQLLNTRWFLPQHRERIYLVGHLRKNRQSQIFPIWQDVELPPTTRQKIKAGSQIQKKLLQTKKDKNAYLKQLTLKLPSCNAQGFSVAEHGDSVNLSFLSSNKRRSRVGKGIAKTMATKEYQYVFRNGRIRRLTPIESERLQGFPDNWTANGNFNGELKAMADVHRYKMLGNSVSVPIVKAIAKKLLLNQNGLTTKSPEQVNSLSEENKTLSGSTSSTLLNTEQISFLASIENNLTKNIKQDNRSVAKLAASLNLHDKTEIKELTELAIVNVCRRIALSHESTEEKYKQIVAVYHTQVILSHRTSQSILLQQYSTPAPIAYLMGVYCALPDLEKNGGYALEPSAGNGLLTIAAPASKIIVNEIDTTRNRNLHTQGYEKVLNHNATEPFPYLGYNKYKALITNPPFGVLPKAVNYSGFSITVLDHLMALRGLDALANDGRAAIIIGGHTHYDSMGRIAQGRNRWFFNYLYRYYHVEDVIPIEGKKLYTRQGTGFPTRLILINGRKLVPDGAAPLRNTETIKVVDSFESLYTRVMRHVNTNEILKTSPMNLDDIKQKAEEIRKRFMNGDLSGNKETGESTDHLKLYRMYKELKPSLPNELVFMESPTLLITFDDDALTVSKILKKTYLKSQSPEGEIKLCVLSKIMLMHYITQLNESGHSFSVIPDGRPTDWKQLQWDALSLINNQPDPDVNGLESPYVPASNACVVLNTEVPDSMERETQAALARIKDEVGGSVDNYVRHRLGYATQTSLCAALSAEQTDAVAMAIYNVEAREQGTIIGDQTGIGKGRIAASMIRYGVKNGLRPIFITEKANLFSDIYRDLIAIGSGHLRPFIINNREAKTDIKDEDGEVIYSALSPSEQNSIFESGEFPQGFDFVLATYTQFNSPDKKPIKPEYLRAISRGSLIILDEAHNASGASNTGNFMQGIVERSKGVVFLSATFAKKPDNMPIYAIKTAISEANLTKESLVIAIKKGGVALQEILSSQLVAEGQMIRRERSFEGVEVNYVQLDEYEEAHRKTSDAITTLLRDIIRFQESFVNKKVSELDATVAAQGKQASVREGTSKAGVDNLPYFSKVFNVINQMLFSIKAEAVAERAIQRLKEGKKPVIAFASTMGSFIEQMPNDKGLPVQDGDTIRLDFAEVLRKGLDGVLRYTVLDIDGNPDHQSFTLEELDPAAKYEYQRIASEIDIISTGISISPIDTVIQKLEEAGYSVAEVTGRKFSVIPDLKNNTGKISSRKRLTTNDAFRQFNNNEVDVLMINQSGSTGASAHAIVTNKVKKEEVKQRIMIVLQAELDINTEVQKRGRINRTGQILKPIYDYVSSAIPAEKRLMMMLQKKLKSLDANTTSNQKQSSKILDVPDFLNKYGDKVVQEYLSENPELDKLLGRPLSNETVTTENEDDRYVEDAAHKVSGRVAVLSTKMQSEFYADMTERYNEYVEYLKQIGEYDLEVEALDLATKTLESNIVIMGKGGESAFGEDSILEKVEANILRKPFRSSELVALVKEALAGSTAEEIKQSQLKEYENDFERRVQSDTLETIDRYDKLIANIPKEKKIRNLAEDNKAFFEAIQARKQELEQEKKEELEKLNDGDSPRERYIKRILHFFNIGRKLIYAPSKDGEQRAGILAVCLGVSIDKKKKNPYARSAIKVKLAIAGSTKYLAVPTSKDRMINSLIAESMEAEPESFDDMMLEWEDTIRLKTKDRGVRYIITGNLLQAFNGNGSKLVSYTTSEGAIKKGILLPEDWEPESFELQKVTVPISRALDLIKALAPHHILTAGVLTLLRVKDDYQLILPSSRSKGGDIYMDEEIWPLVLNEKFELHSDKMKATLPEGNIEKLVEILQRKHSLGMELNLNQLELIEPELKEKMSTRKKIALPPDENEQEDERLRIIYLKAKAIALRLKLAA